ncbi:hypothetical protein C6T59_23895 [Burkholderia multivorans]|nr:hypothetical protein C6Q01_26245 [Burkholderia multivorans]PRF93844.1 hypothetical protein C6Q23_04795 [Burkholderia multivorans]PRG61228.1 hypothetical protein C6T59_23895 [Burkholderia multivorans]
MTPRFVYESRFCFRPSTEHRATQRDRGGRADLHGRRKASAPQQCAGGGEVERTRSLSRTGAAFLHCAAACDPGEGKPASAKKKNKSTKNYSKSARTASGGRPMAALPR